MSSPTRVSSGPSVLRARGAPGGLLALVLLGAIGCRPGEPGLAPIRQTARRIPVAVEPAAAPPLAAPEAGAADVGPTEPVVQVGPLPEFSPIAPARTTGPRSTTTPGRPPVASPPGLLPPADRAPAALPPARTPEGRPAVQPPPARGPAARPPAVETPAAEAPAAERAEAPLLAGWERPDCVLVLTGNQSGYIEPCGCTGLANQKGGLSRRHRLIVTLQEKGWPVVALDAGSQVRRIFRQSEIKYQMTAEALRLMGYDVATFGPDDLQLSSDSLLSLTASIDPGTESMFVAANTALLDRSLIPRFRIIERGGHRIGVTGVIGAGELKAIASDEVLKEAPEAGIAVALEAMKARRCDVLVLLAQASIEESKALAAKFPDFQLVVTGGGGGEPEFLPTGLNGGRTYLVQTGAKGMYAGVVGIYRGTTTAERLRYERVALDARFKDTPAMLTILADYQKQLEVNGLAGLGIRPLPHPTGQRFTGSAKCGECHASAMAVWETSKHAHALETLVHPRERSAIPRHFDPECLSCHVTGWNPQKYYPYESGYLSLGKTAHMGGVGCENCHGPGAGHVAAEEAAADEAATAKFRLQMRLPLAEAEQTCLECHDHDNSPDFHEPGAFEEYWKQVEHYGKD